MFDRINVYTSATYDISVSIPTARSAWSASATSIIGPP